MLSDIAFFVLASLTALFPIVLWGYAFSYLDADRFNARRFALWIFTGAAAVFPIAFMPDIASAVPLFGNVFADIAQRMSTFSVTSTFAVFLSAVGIIVLSAAFVARSSLFDDFYPLLRSLVSVALTAPVFAFAFWILSGAANSSDPEVHIAWATLAGFASIVLAYLAVASIEESSKHLGLFWTGSFADIAQKGALYAAFVALGFSFAENMLYLSSILRSDAPMASFFSTWFSRSVFSVGVHTLCSVAAALPFVRSAGSGATGSRAILLTVQWLIIAIALHAVFDITVSYGKTGIVFVYAIFAYGFLTRAFHKPGQA